jgi:hypothetical protein
VRACVCGWVHVDCVVRNIICSLRLFVVVVRLVAFITWPAVSTTGVF